MKKIISNLLLLLISLVILSAAASALQTFSTRALGRNPDFSGSIIVFETDESEASADLNNDSDKTDTVIRYYNIETKELSSTGIAGKNPAILETKIAFESSEARQNKDLNADGDKNDTVIVYYSLPDKKIIDASAAGRAPAITDTAIVFSTPELETGTDYNNDGDKADSIIRYYVIATKEIINTKQAGANPAANSEYILFEASEKELNEDVNKDNDKDDIILRYYSFGTNQTKDIIAFGQKPAVSKESIVSFTVPEKFTDDLNGDLDIEDEILMYYDIPGQKLTNTKVEGSGTSIFGKTIAFAQDNKISFYNLGNSVFIQTEMYGKDPVVSGNKIAFSTHEFFSGDLNEDGDNKDTVIRYATEFPGMFAEKNATGKETINATLTKNETASKNAVVIIEPAVQKNETANKNASAANKTIAAKPEAKAGHKPLPFEKQQEKTAPQKKKTGPGFFAWLLVILAVATGAGLVIYAVLAHEKKPKKSRF